MRCIFFSQKKRRSSPGLYIRTPESELPMLRQNKARQIKPEKCRCRMDRGTPIAMVMKEHPQVQETDQVRALHEYV